MGWPQYVLIALSAYALLESIFRDDPPDKKCLIERTATYLIVLFVVLIWGGFFSGQYHGGELLFPPMGVLQPCGGCRVD